MSDFRDEETSVKGEQDASVAEPLRNGGGNVRTEPHSCCSPMWT